MGGVQDSSDMDDVWETAAINCNGEVRETPHHSMKNKGLHLGHGVWKDLQGDVFL